MDNQPGTAVDGVPEGAAAEDTRSRILRAAQQQFETNGLRRSTVEDIARRAGMARVTVYRYFPTKSAVVAATVSCEIERFFSSLDAAISAQHSTEDRLVEGFATVIEFTRGHRLLQRLLETEPEALLPHLSYDSPVFQFARSAVTERVQEEIFRGSLSGAHAEQIAELLVRLAHSFVVNPDSSFDLDDPHAVRDIPRRWLAPALAYL